MVIAVILLILGMKLLGRQQMRMEIDSAEIEYIVCDGRDLGPRRLDYQEHKELLDRFFAAVSGEYSYVKSWRVSETDGGGLSTIYLYNHEGDLIDAIRYTNGYLCVATNVDGKYYLYYQKDKSIPFDEFEEALELYGEYAA